MIFQGGRRMGIHRHWQFWLGVFLLLIYYVETGITYTNPTGSLALSVLFVSVLATIYGLIEVWRNKLRLLFAATFGLVACSHTLLAMYANGTFQEPVLGNIAGSAMLLLLMNFLVGVPLISGIFLIIVGMKPIEVKQTEKAVAALSPEEAEAVFQ